MVFARFSAALFLLIESESIVFNRDDASIYRYVAKRAIDFCHNFKTKFLDAVEMATKDKTAGDAFRAQNLDFGGGN